MPEAGTSITVSIDGEFTFTVKELWPDDDAPEVVTAADVVAVLRSDDYVLDELRNDSTVHVHVVRPNPHYAGDHVLFDDPPSRWLRESVTI